MPGAAGHIFVKMKIGMRENVETGTLLVADGDRQGILKFLAKADIQHAGIERFAPHADIEPARTRKRSSGGTGKNEIGGGGEQNTLPAGIIYADRSRQHSIRGTGFQTVHVCCSRNYRKQNYVSNSSNTRIRWLLIFWIFIVSAIAYLDRVNISIAGPSIAKEFHLDNVHLGWVFSAFVLGYAFFQAPGGTLADRFGPRKILGLGVIWWGIFTVSVTVLSPGMGGGMLFALLASRFLLGMGEAVVYPASNCVVASWIPSSERGIANGFIFTGVGVGSAVASPLIAYLMQHAGWRASFWVSALLGVIAGGIWYVIARDTPQTASVDFATRNGLD